MKMEITLLDGEPRFERGKSFVQHENKHMKSKTTTPGEYLLAACRTFTRTRRGETSWLRVMSVDSDCASERDGEGMEEEEMR